jgi:hypothetical protein
MALGSPQPLTEMSTRNIVFGRKRVRCAGLTTLPPCADCLEIWEPQFPGALRACPGLYRNCPTFTFTIQCNYTKKLQNMTFSHGNAIKHRPAERMTLTHIIRQVGVLQRRALYLFRSAVCRTGAF